MLTVQSGISNFCVITASSRLMDHLRDRPQNCSSSHTGHFPLFITLYKRCHTCFLFAVLMNQQRAAEEWPSGHSGKNQVPAVKAFLGDLHSFCISLHPVGGTGQQGALTYLHFTGQAAKKRCCHAGAGGRISFLLADAKRYPSPCDFSQDLH